MKILHLSTCDNFGGAARAAYRQHLALRGAGIDSRMLVRHKHTDDPHVRVFTGNHNLPSRVERTLRRAWIHRLEKQSRAKGIGGLTDPRADLLRFAVQEMADADIINIHKTEHFADIPALLASLTADKPVVITLHDLSPITGGCDYPGGCERFTNACGACPMLDSKEENDYSRKIFRMRQAAYGTRLPENFAFVVNSRWTLDNIKRSWLAKGVRAELVHLALDQNVYQPGNRAVAREALGIGADEAVICFGAHDMGYKHKGGAQLAEALAGLKSNASIHLLTMGSGRISAPPQFKHTHFGRIESDSLQSLIYRAADVFVIPSLEEAFGQTALEAVACGTVVAGFAVGGIVDIVQNDLNGLLVVRGDSNALGHAIIRLLKDEILRVRWRESCEIWVKERFSFDRNATAYRALYESLLATSTKAESQTRGQKPGSKSGRWKMNFYFCFLFSIFQLLITASDC
jgi:glycosyltransferase involved in cell wall biosynthesis